MSGRYLKPPLVYMTALVKTTPFPALLPDQWAAIEQVLVKQKLPLKLVSQGQEIQLLQPTATPESEAPLIRSYTRYGFFSVNRQESLIFEPSSIEWRTSAYLRYNSLCERIEAVLNALMSAADVLGYVPVQELVLTYADVIAPQSGRNLGDYFSGGQNILPLNLINGAHQDLQQVGQVQVTRVIEPQKRIFVSLEQLPVVNHQISRFLPQQMMEPDLTFNMPLPVQAEWQSLACSHYGLLTTQAAMLYSSELKDLNIKAGFEPLHVITRETFRGLVDKTVTDIDWQFQEE